MTFTLGTDFAANCAPGEYVIATMRTTAGFVVVTSSDVSVAGNFGGMWFCATFNGTYTKVATTKGINELSVSRPVVGQNGSTYLAVGEYSTDFPQPVHVLRISTDGGQTWTTRRTAQVIDSTKNSHYHGAAYDTVLHRWWSSQGDNQNSLWSYSDDDGATWHDVAMSPTDPLFQSDSVYQQPTMVAVLGSKIVVTPDRQLPAGVWTMDTTAGNPPTAVWQTSNGEQAQNQFGKVPYAQTGTRLLTVLPDRFSGTKKAYFVGTVDNGATWTLYDTVDMVSSGSWIGGIVGPDSGGRIMFRAANGMPVFNGALVVGTMPS